PFEDRSWTALRSLLLRPYWERIWIVQEVALAKTARLLVGHDEADWYDLYMLNIVGQGFKNDLTAWRLVGELDTPENLLRLTNTFTGAFDAIRNVRMVATDSERGAFAESKLFDLVIKTAGQRATDPRDKLYGLLGLLKDSEVYVQPDYSQPLE